MNLQQRIELLVKLGGYMSGDSEEWIAAKERASRENPWFIPQFVEQAVETIVRQYLQPDY
jgi:hypothetical protein